MFLWVIFALLTASSLLAILFPLIKQRGVSADRNAFDTAVYKDQLVEVDADLARGTISAQDASAARLEIARRLIALDDAKQDGNLSGDLSANNPEKQPVIAVFACAVLIPLISLAIYLNYGSPGLPDQPRAARMNMPVEQQRIDELIARVEEKLRENPNDGRGWDVIAPVYLKHRRYAEATEAYAKAIELQGQSARRLFGLAEATRLANDGIVSDEARAIFEKLLKIEPDNIPALYRLALGKEQDGQFDKATAAWKDILKRLPNEDSSWRQETERRLKRAEARLTGKAAPPARQEGKGQQLSQEQIEAVQQMTPQERQTMINQMVSGLAQRLSQDGNDLQGWLRLVRAYKVLGREDDALKALAEARKVFAQNAAALKDLEALAKQLGLEA